MAHEVRVENLIIGGGLSGLSLAYFLGDNYLVLEKDNTPGGYCRTIPNPKYVWDYAGHFYHFRYEKYKKMFLSMVEEDQIVRQRKNTKIYYKDRLIDYPFQANIHELEKKEFIECLCDLYFRDKKNNYDNFLEMLYAKFGRAITEKFLKPYNEKLYATNLEELDKDAMGRFFPYVDFEQVMESMNKVVGVTYNDDFMYLKKGTGYFIEKIYNCLDKKKVLLNTEIALINRREKYAETISGERFYYKNLISTAPFNNFLRLFREQEKHILAETLSYNKVLVLNLGFDKPSSKYKTEHWVYFPDKALNFYRIGFYNNILNQEKLSVYVEIGFNKKQEAINIDEELKNALKGMEEVGIISKNMALVDKNVLLMDPAYVHISEKELKEVERVSEELEKDNIYTLGRYGKWTYNCMEDCIGLADDLAKILKNKGKGEK